MLIYSAYINTIESVQQNVQIGINWECPAQFQNRIRPQVYVRRITRSTMYEKASFVSRNDIRKISSVACVFSPITIHYFDYLKRFINRINEA